MVDPSLPVARVTAHKLGGVGMTTQGSAGTGSSTRMKGGDEGCVSACQLQ